MPHNLNFSLVNNIKIIELNPIGWINPLYIEYGDFKKDDIYYCAWRIKDTSHTFTIPFARLDYLSSGDYKKHFEYVLQNFKEDLSYQKKQYPEAEWIGEYEQQYSRFFIE